MSLLKRKRSANWMTSEKRLLLDLVAEHFSVIENKKTDGVSMKEKLAQWVKISDEYNSQTTMTHRTADNLKAQWESLKKSAKKEATHNRMELLKTGGGPPEEKTPREKKEDPITSRILSLIHTSAVGLSNPYDSDVIVVVPTSDSQEVASELAQINIIESVPEWKTGDERRERSPTKDLLTPSLMEPISTNADFQADWGDYTPKKLQTPISTQLRGPREEKCIQQDYNKKISSRRRPIPIATTSMGTLEEKKIEAITMQMKYAREEREEMKRLNNVELLIKKQVLKQHQIRTRLLLLKLRAMKK